MLFNFFNRKKSNRLPRLFLTGFAMGAADIIPGISGGTVAFILGVYEELLQAIKTCSGKVLQLALQGKFKDSWNTIPFSFLIPVVGGLSTAILTMAGVISYLMNTYPVFVWSFFFGLMIASGVLVSRRIVSWQLRDFGVLAASTVGTYFLVGAVPVETPSNLLTFFFSGFIAICAMILPGISGSFILLLLGKYEQVLEAVLHHDILTLGVFMLGAIIGLAVFARALAWLFARHHDIVIALLTGFMIGALRKLWPWKEVITTRINSKGVEVPVQDINILPESFDISVIIAVCLAIAGFIVIYYLNKFEILKEQTEDLEDPAFERDHQKALTRQKN